MRDEDQLHRAQGRLGKVLRERWRLDELLGLGGMAAVYAATHRNGKRVALKMLHPELSTLGQVKQRFIDEGYLANRVGHPGAVSVIDDGIADDGAVYLIMDLLQGETLEERMRRLGPVEPGDLLPIIDSLLDVLGAAHERGIVHRDVKPDNIFLTSEGLLKLLDFGIARFSEPGRPHTTRLGETMGTPAFMPPEQARGHWNAVDGRSDLWAVGATMFFAMSGQPVHYAETANEELLAAMTKNAPSVATVVPTLPRPVVALVDKALAFDKTERWPDALSMRAAVQQIMQTMPAPRAIVRSPTTGPPMVVSTPPMGFPTRPAWSFLHPLLGEPANRRKVLIGTAASAALVVAVLLGHHPPDVAPGALVAPPEGPARAETLAPPAAELRTPVPSASASELPGETASTDETIPRGSIAPAVSASSAPARGASAEAPPPAPRKPAAPAVQAAPRAKPRVEPDPLERRK